MRPPTCARFGRTPDMPRASRTTRPSISGMCSARNGRTSTHAEQGPATVRHDPGPRRRAARRSRRARALRRRHPQRDLLARRAAGAGGARGLLGCFDYLSTVSGGGFVGAWWSAWLSRDVKPNALFPPHRGDRAAGSVRHVAGYPGYRGLHGGILLRGARPRAPSTAVRELPDTAKGCPQSRHVARHRGDHAQSRAHMAPRDGDAPGRRVAGAAVLRRLGCDARRHGGACTRRRGAWQAAHRPRDRRRRRCPPARSAHIPLAHAAPWARHLVLHARVDRRGDRPRSGPVRIRPSRTPPADRARGDPAPGVRRTGQLASEQPRSADERIVPTRSSCETGPRELRRSFSFARSSSADGLGSLASDITSCRSWTSARRRLGRTPRQGSAHGDGPRRRDLHGVQDRPDGRRCLHAERTGPERSHHPRADPAVAARRRLVARRRAGRVSGGACPGHPTHDAAPGNLVRDPRAGRIRARRRMAARRSPFRGHSWRSLPRLGAVSGRALWLALATFVLVLLVLRTTGPDRPCSRD